MRIAAWARWPVWAVARVLLLTASPFQLLVDRGAATHRLMIAEGLRRMGKTLTASPLVAYEKELLAGVAWADTGWKNITHYFHPATGQGLLLFPSALAYYQRYLARAEREARRGNWPKAAFYLGAAAHLVQDMCVPHHATANVFYGHREFESWVVPKAAKLVRQATDVQVPRDAEGIFRCAADVSAGLFALIRSETEEAYAEAARILLPLAAETTAQLFICFAGNLLRQDATQKLRLVATR